MIPFVYSLKFSKFKKISLAAKRVQAGLGASSDSDLVAMLSFDHVVDALAAVSELSRRKLGLDPFVEQLIAAQVCMSGMVVDMKTGEGKTLAAAIAAILLSRRGYVVTVATANAYLAQRDYLDMRMLYEACGVSVGRLNFDTLSELSSVYYAHLTEEGCLKWLSDHLASCPAMVTQPHLLPSSTAKTALIVDEIDQSLIASSSVNYTVVGETGHSFLYQQIAESARVLSPDESYRTVNSSGVEEFTEEFYSEIERRFVDECLISTPRELYEDSFELLIHFRAAYTAFHLLSEGCDYVFKQELLYRIDQSTGRLVYHGYVEAVCAYIYYKHGRKQPSGHRELISCSLQHYVKSFGLLSGMSGTASLNALEIKHSYGVPTIKVPTRLPQKRVDHGHVLFSTKNELYDSVSSFLSKSSRVQRPALLVCESEAQAELFANRLTQKAVSVTLLTSSNLEDEALVFSRAGELGAVTVTTRLCGRGTDIVCSDQERGLLIIVVGVGLTANDDLQVIGRTGRQGAMGETFFCISMEDDHFKTSSGGVFAGNLLKNLVQHDLENLQHSRSRATSKLVGQIQRLSLSTMRERRKRVSIYNNPISSQLKLLAQKRESILLSESPVLMLRAFAGEQMWDSRVKRSVEACREFFSSDREHSNFVSLAMAEGLTSVWHKHHAEIINIRMDASTNAQAASNINNFKKSCFEAFVRFSGAVNSDIAEFAAKYLESKALELRVGALVEFSGDGGR